MMSGFVRIKSNEEKEVRNESEPEYPTQLRFSRSSRFQAQKPSTEVIGFRRASTASCHGQEPVYPRRAGGPLGCSPG